MLGGAFVGRDYSSLGAELPATLPIKLQHLGVVMNRSSFRTCPYLMTILWHLSGEILKACC